MKKLVNLFIKYLKSKYMNIIIMNEFRFIFKSHDWNKISICEFESFDDPNLNLLLELGLNISVFPQLHLF